MMGSAKNLWKYRLAHGVLKLNNIMVGDTLYYFSVHEEFVFTGLDGSANDALCREVVRRVAKGEKLKCEFGMGECVGFGKYSGNPIIYIKESYYGEYKAGQFKMFHPHWYQLGEYARKYAKKIIKPIIKERVIFS